MKTPRSLMILALILVIFCTAAFQTVPEEEPIISKPQEELNPITGTPISNTSLLTLPPVFIPLARYPSAFRPSSGHSQAQWVFETYIEGGESRPILMFYGELPTAPISHISSGYFGLETLRKQYGGIIIMGGTSKSVLDTDIRSYELWYGAKGDELYPELPVADYQRILNKWAPLVTPADPNNLKYEFDENPPEGGRTADSVYIRYARTNQVLWEYDPNTGKYMRGQSSVEEPDVILADIDSGNGQDIGVENLIILMTQHDFVPDTDPALGFFDINLNYVAKNPALIFRDGKIYNVTWTTKSDLFEVESNRMRPIRFLDADGNNFRLKPGKTWVHIIMTGNPYYEVDEELGSQVSAGSGYWKIPYISFKPGSQEQVEQEVAELQGLNYQLNGAQ